MTKFDEFSTKLNEEWTEFQKNFVKVGNAMEKETAGAAAEVLKGIAKELGTLGERLEKWVETSKKAPAPDAQKTEEKKDAPPAA